MIPVRAFSIFLFALLAGIFFSGCGYTFGTTWPEASSIEVPILRRAVLSEKTIEFDLTKETEEISIDDEDWAIARITYTTEYYLYRIHSHDVPVLLSLIGVNLLLTLLPKNCRRDSRPRSV